MREDRRNRIRRLAGIDLTVPCTAIEFATMANCFDVVARLVAAPVPLFVTKAMSPHVARKNGPVLAVSDDSFQRLCSMPFSSWDCSCNDTQLLPSS